MSKSNKSFDNISLTAYRILAIFLMLKEAPHSESEINEKLKNDKILARSISRDSVWLYISTLRAIGCEILRPTKNNGYKYVLKDHPFKINLEEDEISSLFEVKKYVSNFFEWELCCNYDKFLYALFKILTPETKDAFVNHLKTPSREINYSHMVDLIKELELHCSKNSFISITYTSAAGNTSEKKIFAEQIKYENGALYIWGYNVDLEETQYLRIDRIDSIKELDSEPYEIFRQPVKVIYKLFNEHVSSYHPSEDEVIIAKDEKSITIESSIKNRFKLIQKILSFGTDCIVLEPEDLQMDILRKLKLMSKLYNK